MKIVPMNESHVAQVAALEKSCFSDPWSERSIASELNNPLSCWLVALEGEVVAGYVGSQTVLDETDMMNIAVREDFRRMGVATKLVLALMEALKARGSRRLTLEVRVSNKSAQRLYAHLGFTQVGRRKNYYFHPREDGIILRKEWEA